MEVTHALSMYTTLKKIEGRFRGTNFAKVRIAKKDNGKWDVRIAREDSFTFDLVDWGFSTKKAAIEEIEGFITNG